MATRLQQVLVDVPISRLRDGESARSYIHTLSSRCGIASTDLQQQFHELLSGVFASSLGFWICDYVAIVCADASITSSDPEEHTVLQPTGVLAWCQDAAQELQNKVVTLVKSSATSEAQPDQAIDLYHAAKTLLAIAEAVQAALGNRRCAQGSKAACCPPATITLCLCFILAFIYNPACLLQAIEIPVLPAEDESYIHLLVSCVTHLSADSRARVS